MTLSMHLFHSRSFANPLTEQLLEKSVGLRHAQPARHTSRDAAAVEPSPQVGCRLPFVRSKFPPTSLVGSPLSHERAA